MILDTGQRVNFISFITYYRDVMQGELQDYYFFILFRMGLIPKMHTTDSIRSVI